MPLVECTECRRLMSTSATRCPGCGAPGEVAIPEWSCQRCSRPLGSSQEVCPDCDASRAAPGRPSAPVPPPDHEPETLHGPGISREGTMQGAIRSQANLIRSEKLVGLISALLFIPLLILTLTRNADNPSPQSAPEGTSAEASDNVATWVEGLWQGTMPESGRAFRIEFEEGHFRLWWEPNPSAPDGWGAAGAQGTFKPIQGFSSNQGEPYFGIRTAGAEFDDWRLIVVGEELVIVDPRGDPWFRLKRRR